jgi:hypothetical protein
MRLATILTALFFINCAAALPPEAAGQVWPFTPPSAGEDDAEAVEKWNSYVDLANELEAIFLPALNAYLETFGHRPEYQPTQGSGLFANYFLVLMERPEDLSRTLDRAARPAADEGNQGDELDRAVQELIPYLKTLWTDLGRSRDLHLERRAEVREPQGETRELRVRLGSPEDLHARIFAAYQGFTATYERFRGLLTRAGQERRQKDIQELRGKGRVIRPALLEILDAGQGLQDYLNVRQVSGTALGDPEGLRPFLVRLENAAQTLETANAAGGDREGLSEKALAEFHAQLQMVLTQAADLAGEGAGGGRNSPDGLFLALSRLVDIYNLME